jgi:predicted chitinase
MTAFAKCGATLLWTQTARPHTLAPIHVAQLPMPSVPARIFKGMQMTYRRAYEGRRDLGNTQPGDGPRFKGRGLIQLTGRANYQQYGQAIGRDLLTNEQWRQVADDPNLAVDVACWYWETRRLNPFADQDDITTITRRINGGLNGLTDRQRLLARARFFLGLQTGEERTTNV